MSNVSTVTPVTKACVTESDVGDIVEWLSDWRNRLYGGIYSIKDKGGVVVPYEPNWVQRDLYEGFHTRNIIPKARQHGITTAVCLYYLDRVLFHRDQRAAIIAHRENDASKIFANKIKWVFDNIDVGVRMFLPSVSRQTNEAMEFSNGSTIYVDTMVRSDTLNYLHVSELGKMSAWYPIKAEEVRTGAFPAAEGGMMTIESTMEGRVGLMNELCDSALEVRGAIELSASTSEPRVLGPKDFKFFFYPWWRSPDYCVSEVTPIDEDTARVVKLRSYFDRLRDIEGIILSEGQKRWYILEERVLGWRMKQEYPSTFEESVSVGTEGSFFGEELEYAKDEGRITRVTYDPRHPVYAALDIGFKDPTAIWTFQCISNEIKFLDYMEDNGRLPDHYCGWLGSRGYPIQWVYLPHDAAKTEGSTGSSNEHVFRQILRCGVSLLTKDHHEMQGIELARGNFRRVWINERSCARGIESLSHFSRVWNRSLGLWEGKSRHDEWSHGAKAFIYSIQASEKASRSMGDYTAEELSALKGGRRWF